MNLVPSPLQKLTSSLERSFRVGGLAADAPNGRTSYVPAVRETVALIGNSAWTRIPTSIRRRIMLAVIIVTANHYLIDAIVGGGVALVGLAVSARITTKPSTPPA